LIIRHSVDTDSTSIQAIYAVDVLSGTASFELEPPPVGEIQARRNALVSQGYPHIVGEIDGSIAGYAYAGPYRSRPGYRYTVENSVYVAAWARRRGVGKKLLGRLIEICDSAGFRQMVAVIGDSAHTASIELHREAGFVGVGTLENVGFKFGRWLDSVLMQKRLGPGALELPGKNDPYTR
jgi:phosphinothricin acetyltransferase